MGFPKLPSPLEMWARHEELILEIFHRALEMLREDEELAADEDLVNEKLALCARKANFELNKIGRGLTFPPEWEKPKQPSSEADLGKSLKRKRPDFSCPFRNNAADNDLDAYVDYHVECKRLGKPPSPSWVLNKNYVTNGIYRFLDPDYAYGEGAHSGAMVGYIQSMNPRAIIEEVNTYAESVSLHPLPAIAFDQKALGKKHILKSKQPFSRLHVRPRKFHIWHIWVKLRN